jgi:hypothetical protein
MVSISRLQELDYEKKEKGILTLGFIIYLIYRAESICLTAGRAQRPSGQSVTWVFLFLP